MISGVDKGQQLDHRARSVHPDELSQIGNALVIAPHPDDESLGCGGTIALLRERDHDVHVLFVSDGTMSHPNSRSYPAERLRQLRETEALEALHTLNVPPDNAIFLRLKDRQVPTTDQPGFAEAAATMRDVLERLRPDTVLVPWRRDPHPDHRASWQLLNAAVAQAANPPRVLEYLIWLWELGDERDMPGRDEVQVWRVPIDSVMDLRNGAIAAHRSQVTRMIDDDPTAFYLSPELLTHFDVPKELFLETI